MRLMVAPCIAAVQLLSPPVLDPGLLVVFYDSMASLKHGSQQQVGGGILLQYGLAKPPSCLVVTIP